MKPETESHLSFEIQENDYLYTEQKMQSINSVKEGDDINIYDEIVKFDRLLRLYRCYKKSDDSNKDSVKVQCERILNKLKKNCTAKFQQCEEKLLNLMDTSFLKQNQKEILKKKSSQSSKISKKVSSSSSFGSSLQSQSFQENIKTIKNPSNGVSKQETEKIKSHNSFASSSNIFIESSSYQKSPDSSQSIPSMNEGGTIAIKEYCNKHELNFESKLSINDDLLHDLIKKPEDKAFLLGVQKPESMNTEKLYFCAVMEFELQQARDLKYLNKYNSYGEEQKKFENGSRIPLALVIKGTNIGDMKMEYVKFLLEFSSPSPIVIILNSESLDNSIVIRMTENALKKIQQSSFFDISKLNENFIKDGRMYKKCTLGSIQKCSTKGYATKYLICESNKRIQNDQAIKVTETPFIELDKPKQQENQRKENEKEEKQKSAPEEIVFNYKVHAKFMSVCPKQELYFYSLSADNQLHERTKLSNIKAAPQLLEKAEGLVVLGYTVKKQKQPLNPQYLVALWQNRKKSPLCLVRYKGISGSQKVFFINFKEDIAAEDIRDVGLSVTDIERDDNHILNKIMMITKGNVGAYETKNPVKQFC